MENIQVMSGTLADADAVALESISPKKAQIETISAIFWILLPICGALFGLSVRFGPTTIIGFWWAGVPFALLISFFLVVHHKELRGRGYAIRARDVIVRQGLLWQRQIVVPNNRLQHIEVHRPFIDRQFGLAEVHLYTAGATGADAKIIGLQQIIADRIAAQLSRHTDGVGENDNR